MPEIALYLPFSTTNIPVQSTTVLDFPCSHLILRWILHTAVRVVFINTALSKDFWFLAIAFFFFRIKLRLWCPPGSEDLDFWPLSSQLIPHFSLSTFQGNRSHRFSSQGFNICYLLCLKYSFLSFSNIWFLLFFQVLAQLLPPYSGLSYVMQVCPSIYVFLYICFLCCLSAPLECKLPVTFEWCVSFPLFYLSHLAWWLGHSKHSMSIWYWKNSRVVIPVSQYLLMLHMGKWIWIRQ